MRVLCVTPIITTSEGAENRPRPQVGDKDIVIDERVLDGSTYYILERFGNKLGYITTHFATLPDATADEMREESREAIVNLENCITMAHNLVKLLTDEDGEPMPPVWHFPLALDGSNRCICNGQVFGEGEGAAKFTTKIVQRGGITCPECLSIIKSFKKVKL